MATDLAELERKLWATADELRANFQAEVVRVLGPCTRADLLALCRSTLRRRSGVYR